MAVARRNHQAGRARVMIRLASVGDAAALDHFFGQLDREPRFML